MELPAPETGSLCGDESNRTGADTPPSFYPHRQSKDAGLPVSRSSCLRFVFLVSVAFWGCLLALWAWWTA